MGPAPIAEGRDAAVFAHGPGLVLRRYRVPHDTVREAAVMQLARAHGVPVPEVLEVTGTDMVMERVDGPTLLDWAVARPWRLRVAPRILADLHRRVAAVPAPEWLAAPFGDGSSLIHLDLHPLNVLVTGAGPVVIDWTNASRGPAAADVAQTWVIMATSEIPGSRPVRTIVGAARGLFVRRFLRAAGREAAVPFVRAAAAHRLADRNVTDGERPAVERLAARIG